MSRGYCKPDIALALLADCVADVIWCGYPGFAMLVCVVGDIDSFPSVALVPRVVSWIMTLMLRPSSFCNALAFWSTLRSGLLRRFRVANGCLVLPLSLVLLVVSMLIL